MLAHYAYWTSTAMLSLLYLASVTLYVTKRDFVRQSQAALGYSATHLVPFMIVVKVLGPVAILSRFSVPLSDLAYAGLFYHLILAGMAHLGVRKPKEALPAAVGMVLLVTSFITQNAAREVPSPYAPRVTQSIPQPLN